MKPWKHLIIALAICGVVLIETVFLSRIIDSGWIKQESNWVQIGFHLLLLQSLVGFFFYLYWFYHISRAYAQAMRNWRTPK